MNSKNVKKVLSKVINTMEKKAKYQNMPEFAIVSFDTIENYTFVAVQRGTKFYQGVSKRNPNCDKVDETRGLTIALNRAIHRMLDKKDNGSKMLHFIVEPIK